MSHTSEVRPKEIGRAVETKLYGLDGFTVSVDIKPGSCPNPLDVRKRGELPVAILGSEDFDLSEIDRASIRLEGVPALRSSFEDVATPFGPLPPEPDCFDCTRERKDGYMDLTLKFDAQEVINAIDPWGELEHKDCLVLTVTGNLLEECGGTPFEGEDVLSFRKE